ncbi:MAG: DNA repair exonuclease [Acidobacteriota bacterium]|jgi:DNA repair exonuclease SbcCD nuclease subunit|nr:DNA repair exonuclease [Acidobacteriota bacterium]
MRAFSFLHCADLHLGATIKTLTGLPTEFGPRLINAPIAALDRIVTTAIEKKVAGVIMAGDVFDNTHPSSVHSYAALRDRLQKLGAAGIPTFIVTGNHDPLDNTVSNIVSPELVHFFGTKVDDIPLMRGDEILAHIYGVSYGTSRETKNLATDFPSKPKGPFSIAVLHTNVAGQTGHDSYAPCELADLVEKEFDYWALGHVHTRKTLREKGPVVHYPGNVQGLHRNEEGPRGVTLVEVASDGSVEISPVWTDTIRWHREETSIDDLKSVGDVMDMFAKITDKISGDSPDQLNIVSWKLNGSGPVHAELRNPMAHDGLVEALREKHAPEPHDGAVWLRQLNDETSPARDIDQLRKQQDLLGNLLTLAEKARHNPGPRVSAGIDNDLDSSSSNQVSSEIEMELEELLGSPDLYKALGEDPWRAIDWNRVLARSEVRSINELLDKDVDP